VAGNTAGAPFTYQWRKDGRPLADGLTTSGSTLRGTDMPVLAIFNVSVADEGGYDVVITNACDSATSRIAVLGVLPVVTPDLDADCDVDLDDFAVFHACFSGPTVAYSGDCAKADFGIFQRCFSGPNVPADPNCAN